jgi:hypothetical protein
MITYITREWGGVELGVRSWELGVRSGEWGVKITAVKGVSCKMVFSSRSTETEGEGKSKNLVFYTLVGLTQKLPETLIY